MALTATIYNLDTELAHVDRSVYATFRLKLARQPSETLEYMLTRYLAYCLEHTEGIALGDEPAVLVRDLTAASRRGSRWGRRMRSGCTGAASSPAGRRCTP